MLKISRVCIVYVRILYYFVFKKKVICSQSQPIFTMHTLKNLHTFWIFEIYTIICSHSYYTQGLGDFSDFWGVSVIDQKVRPMSCSQNCLKLCCSSSLFPVDHVDKENLTFCKAWFEIIIVIHWFVKFDIKKPGNVILIIVIPKKFTYLIH